MLFLLVERAPAGRGYRSINQLAGRRRLPQCAIVAPLATLGRSLIADRLLRDLVCGKCRSSDETCADYGAAPGRGNKQEVTPRDARAFRKSILRHHSSPVGAGRRSALWRGRRK